MRFISFIIGFLFILISGSECFSSQDGTAQGSVADISVSSSSSDVSTDLTHDDEILVQSPKARAIAADKARTYFVQSGGAFAIHDKDFREFLDYGASFSVGMKQKIKPKISLVPTLGLIILKGEWSTSSDRPIVRSEAETYYPGYISTPENPITPEDINEENLGESYSGGGEAVVTSSELLQRLELDTSLYIIPLTLNGRYQLHEGGKKFNPYVGGGFGFCIAKREVESNVLKERYSMGPEYTITFDNSQTVTGRVLQFLAGFEMPVKYNIKLVAEASTSLFHLNNFDPILSISPTYPTPEWYDGTDLTQINTEEPLEEIGVFSEEFVTSISIGFVLPF